MDDFDTKNPLEARDIAIQFLGQQMSELKEYNTRLVEPASTLTSIKPNVEQIVKSIPLSPVVAQPAPDSQVTFQPPPAIILPSAPPVENKDQLELNFTYDIVKDLVARVTRIESTCKDILKYIQEGKSLPTTPVTQTLKKS